MQYVYGVFLAVGAYEGEDVMLGLYSDYVNARDFMLAKLAGRSAKDEDFYIQKIKLNEKCDIHYQNINGEYLG